MATVQIRNLDDDAYEVLKRRASDSRRSLQEYLRLLLEEQASRPSMAETLERARVDLSWTGDRLTMDEIVAIQRAGRER